eukprot:Hpha_TRINITY_DN29641_c0_g1::TRINITY_DN29641_c0_g1_i1::g.165142::m.165142/K00101/lldD; L-lactate dehydrogenase (cytochrome)
MPESRVVSVEELGRHNTAGDCWVGIHGRVFDLTTFADSHPGGSALIHGEAGRDGTSAFSQVHSASLLRTVEKRFLVGRMEGATDEAPAPKAGGAGELGRVLCLHDFEKAAEKVMPKDTWLYYSTGTEDEVTMRENEAAFRRYFLVPRVCIGPSLPSASLATTILGQQYAAPFFIAASAVVGMAHEDGELGMARAAASADVLYMMPLISSRSHEEVAAAHPKLMMQQYIARDRVKARDSILKAVRLGMKALVVTVDLPVMSRRERDMRNSGATVAVPHLGNKKVEGSGVSDSLTLHDPAFGWGDIAWVRSLLPPGMPLVLKGIQCAEDAVLAVQHGADGIIVSNHGGRSLDGSRAAIDALPEVVGALREAGLRGKVQVLLESGVRRGVDVLRALALGADGVGLARPFLYALGAFGEAGVRRALDLLAHETLVSMQLLGCSTVGEVAKARVTTRGSRL